MKKAIYIFIILFLFSCDKKNEKIEKVDLQILSKAIISNKESLDKEGKPVKNLIEYKLTNKSNEKLFFVLDEDNIESGIRFTEKDMSTPLFFGKKGKLLYDIATEKGVKPVFSIIITDNFESGNIDCLYDVQKINETRNKILEYGFPVVEGDYKFSYSIRRNSFILYPNQSKYFKSVLYLPKQIDTISRSSSEIQFKYKEKYNFNLVYMSDTELVKKALPDYKLKELKENNIQIFNGKLLSNRVPIKFVD